MEFTINKPSKSVAVHSSPYGSASGGKTYLNNFRSNLEKRKSVQSSPTPPRKYGHKIFSSKGNSPYMHRAPSRTSNILQNSVSSNTKKQNSKSPIWISKADKNPSPLRSCKRPIKSLENSLDTASDPYNVFSDDDDDVLLSSKHEKFWAGDTNKENKLKISMSRGNPKVYSNNSSKKLKPLDISNSSILHDISPEKVLSSYSSEHTNNFYKSENKNAFKFKSFTGKENNSTIKENEEKEGLSSIAIEHPHLIGFPNFGNTCYLNAVLQTIVNIQPFINDLSTAMNVVNVPSTSVVHSLWNIITARHKLDLSVIRNSLRAMKENVEKIDGSFSGFKMQDANEFLTQVLDTVKDEIDKLANQSDSHNNCVQTPDRVPSLSQHHYLESKSVLSSNCKEKQTNNYSSIFGTPTSSSPVSLEIKIKDNSEHILGDDIFLTPKQKQILTSHNKIQYSSPRSEPRNPNNNKVALLNNPVTNNFEFELFESYRCLGCNETESRKQKHFALYVNLPSEGSESIQKAVEAYMSEDQRDLTCTKCKHQKASFLTSFLQLPRVLIVQMKRYEYKPEQLECVKVSSKVDVNMWLYLDKLTSSELSSPPKFKKGTVSFQCSKESKSKTLSVRNLSSELNICSPSSEEAVSSPAKTVSSNPSDGSVPSKGKEQEDKELQEVLIRSMKDVGGDSTPKSEAEPDKEDEDLQQAIKLSLQDLGMCYSRQVDNEESTNEVKIEELIEERDHGGKNSYHLYSVISHFGLTTCTGHYVSDVLNFEENRWYHYDDETVTSLPESVLLSDGRQKNGYIFFYVHQDIYDELRNPK